MKKILAWISAARLRTLPLAVSCILTGSAVAKQNGLYRQDIFWLAVLTTLGFQILSNFANDYGDGVKGTDSKGRVGPSRALQSGLLTAGELRTGMVITVAITLLLATLLIFVSFGNENFLLSFIFFNLGIASIIAAVTYTVGKGAYGYRAMGDLFVFVFFGIIGVAGSYFLYSKSLADWVLLPAIAIGLLCVAVLNLNNMRDRRSDETVGKRTLAVLLGDKKVRIYHFVLILAALLSMLAYLSLSAPKPPSYLAMIAFIPLFVNAIKVLKVSELSALDPELKKVALATFFLSLLLFAGQWI